MEVQRENQEEVVQEADEAKMLVLKRALSILRGTKEEQQSHLPLLMYRPRESVLLDY